MDSALISSVWCRVAEISPTFMVIYWR